MSLKSLALLLLLATPLALAQQAPTAPRPAAYRVQFFLHETQPGHAAVVHTYSLRVEANAGESSLQVGRRVPVSTGQGQMTYEAIGLSLNCSAEDAKRNLPADQLALRVRLRLSSLVPDTSPSVPTIQSTVADLGTAVPLGQRVSVSQFEDTAGAHAYELEVLATPLPAGTAAAPAALH